MHQQANQHAQQLAAVQQAAAAAPRPAQLPKLGSVDKFAGSMSRVDKFVRDLEAFLAYHAIQDDAMKLRVGCAHLTDAALVWYNSLAIKPVTWVDFLARLRARFHPLEENLTGRLKLGTLRQAGSSVSDYTNRFQTVVAGINNMGEADQVHHYMFGLKPAILQRVLEKQPSTLVAAIELAASVEASLGLLGRAMGSSHFGNRQGAGASSASDTVPMDINHVSHDELDDDFNAAPRFHEEPAARTAESALMAKLAAMEHQLAALQNFSAPKLANKNNDRVAGLKSSDINRLMKEGKCFRCQKVGHLKRDCPQAVNSNRGKSANY